MGRRKLLTLGAVILLPGCIGLFEDDTPPLEGSDDRRDHSDDFEFYEDADHDLVDPYDSEDEQEEHPATGLEFEGFTHFPFDFEHAFSNPESFWHDGYFPWPIQPFFTPWDKVFHSAKWYLNNPHDPLYWDQAQSVYIAEWPSYLMADAQLHEDDIVVYIDGDGGDTGDVPYHAYDGSLHEDAVDGDPVYGGVDLHFELGSGVSVTYEKFRVRRAIIEAVADAGGVATFGAGTHVGYGLGGLMVYDETADPYPFNFSLVNPFDYFTPELQDRILTAYRPMYDILREEGIHPFTDLAKSDIVWDVPGSLEGTWLNEAYGCAEIREERWFWGAIGFVGLEHLNDETYWRVLEHPWNVEQGFVGLFFDATIREHEWPERFLYDVGDRDRPLMRSRFYLRSGDLTEGVAMIIADAPWDGWDPMDPDDDDNHPSLGERRYLRFEVDRAAYLYDEYLTIQGFLSEADASAGFTDDALVYRRSVEDC